MIRYLAWQWLVLVFIASFVCAKEDSDVEPTDIQGASVFYDRCLLCHGPDGMGEGVLAMQIPDYPSTNLLRDYRAKTKNEIREAVVYGGSKGRMSIYMPPMGNDLTWTEVESVVSFIELLRRDTRKALDLLEHSEKHQKPNRRYGRQIFRSRCVLCHGKFGEGDGRMAKIIKSPPPANLVKSRLPDDYLKKIIRLGGEGVKRSPQMPPWESQLRDTEIESVILFIKSIRE